MSSLGLLPEQVAPYKLFARHVTVSGSIPVSSLKRLREYLSNEEGHVHAEVLFSTDEDQNNIISAKVRARISLICQRCLGETVADIESSLKLKALLKDQQPFDPEEMEVLEISEDKLDLLSLIEDELILSLPIVAYHEQNDCNQILEQLKQNSSQHQESNKRENPFKALEVLKKKP